LGIPIGIAVIRLGGWTLGALVAFVAVVGTHEFYEMIRKKGAGPFGRVGMACSAALVLWVTARPEPAVVGMAFWAGAVALALVALVLSVFTRGAAGAPAASATGTVYGVLYCGATLAFVPLLRAMDAGGSAPWAGTAVVIFPLVVTWVGDSCAYFGGRAWGRRPLAPKVSPKKTIEGGLSGLAGAVASAAAYAAWAFPAAGVDHIPILAAAVAGLILGPLGQVGDLAESVLKREAGVKDSGTLLPGHGGIMDRFDAVLFTVPAWYGLLMLWGWAT